MKWGQEEENDIRAEQDGLAKSLSVGTRILKLDPGYKGWNNYVVKVLDGAMTGRIGWVRYDAIKGHHTTIRIWHG